MQQTKRTYAVVLNVYDLAGANDYTHGLGVGFYHSGVEVNGREWTFGSGNGTGTGVMEHRPRETGQQVRPGGPLGETELSAGDIERTAWDLGRDFFQANRYNLLMCNCNHFADAYALALGVERTVTELLPCLTSSSATWKPSPCTRHHKAQCTSNQARYSAYPRG